jgi:putative methionine-R-sulfoxide reductase with GAF domain
LPRHDAEALRIEVAEIDDVDAHDTHLTCQAAARLNIALPVQH